MDEEYEESQSDIEDGFRRVEARDSDGDLIPDGIRPDVWERYKNEYKTYHQDYSEAEYIKSVNKCIVDFTDKINFDIVNKTYDKPLLDYVVNAFRAFETIRFVKFIGYEYSIEESKIDENRYIQNRGKGWKKTIVSNGRKKRINVHEYKEIDDSRCGLLTLHFEIAMEVQAMDENKKVIPDAFVVKRNKVKINILIPIEDEEGYYQLKGKRKYLIYQLTEKSTYTTMGAVTLKSLMPVYVKRIPVEVEDINEVGYKIPCYILRVFDKDQPILLFFMSNGVDRCLQNLLVADIIKFKDQITDFDKEISVIFKIGAKLYLVVNRYMFDKYLYVRSVVGGIMSVVTNHMTMSSVYDVTNYIKRIGGNNYSKGENTLLHFHRLLDDNTRDILKLDESYTLTIYDMLAYIMQNFNELRKKDNLSLDHKRLRRKEVVAALCSTDISRRISDVIKKGNRVTMDEILNSLRIPANILIQKMNNSRLFKHDDIINDNQALMKLAYTIKGPNSVGGKNSNKISKAIRGIHPSYLGELDILHCGNSDPGTSGIINPFTKMKSLYFDDEPEPDDFLFEYMEDYDKVLTDVYGMVIIYPTCNGKKEFYERQRRLREAEEGLIRNDAVPIGGFLDEEAVSTDINDNKKEESDPDEG